MPPDPAWHTDCGSSGTVASVVMTTIIRFLNMRAKVLNMKLGTIGIFCFVAALSIGCSDSSGPEGTAPVRISFADVGSVGQAAAVSGLNYSLAGAGGASGLIVTSGSNTLEINLVKMTLEDIDLERTDQSVDCSAAGSGDFSDCSDYFAGPLLVQLDLNGSAQTTPLTVDAPFGTFDMVSFDISVPDGGDPAQEAYLAANEDMRGVSLLIDGTFNGADFAFALDLRGDQELLISPPLLVTESNTGFSITMTFDIASWFVRPDGSLMDPSAICSADVGCADRSTVEQNIERSIQAYSDL